MIRNSGNRWTQLLTLLAILLLPVQAWAEPESGSQYQPLQDLLEAAVQQQRSNAVVGMLAQGDQVLWLGVAGEMSDGVPMRKDAILPLASVGKMFTATAAMILIEQGRLQLDDPVSKYIPEFAGLRFQGSEDGAAADQPAVPITVHHLLTHTSGLTVDGNEFWNAWNLNVGVTTTTHFSRDLAALPLHAVPGTRFEYGQTGAAYEVLGAVIEKASGQTLEAFMQEHIFDPLQLTSSSFYVPPEQAHRLPEIHRLGEEGLTLERPQGEDFSRSTFFHGGGGVRSSAADLHRFARLFLNRGSVDGTQLVSAEGIALMMQDQLGELAPDRWQQRGLSWGYGAAVEIHRDNPNQRVLRAYGWVGGGFAKLWVMPQKNMIAYVNLSLSPPGDNRFLFEFEQAVYALIGD